MAGRSSRNPYEVLGVAPTATDDEIRMAYRALARRVHPDRSDGAADRMAEVNDAYYRLRDRGRRAMVDAELRGTGSAAPRSQRPTGSRPYGDGHYRIDDDEEPPPYQLSPAQVPWRTIMTFGALAIIAVLVLSQFATDTEPPGPDGLLRVGECVGIEPDFDAFEVACTGTSEDLVIRAFIPFDATCPGGLARHRDRQGMGMVCVEPRP